MGDFLIHRDDSKVGRRLARAGCVVALTLVLGCQQTPSEDRNATPPPTEQSEETRRMIARLAELARPADARANAFTPEALVAFYEQMEPPPDIRSQVQLEAQKARALLHAGRSEESLALLEATRLRVAEQGKLFKPAFVDNLDDLTALAALRFGEQKNCLLDHSSDACLLPIRDGGVHREPEGARRAMTLWAELLERRRIAGLSDEEQLGTRWLLNIAAMAAGEHPDGVSERWRIPVEVFASQAPMPRFHDLAPALGVDVVGLSGGVVIEDFDGDLRLDLLVSSWGLGDPLRLFQQASGLALQWVDVTETSGLRDLTGGLNLVPGDFDNDGDVDVLVLRGAWQGAHGLHPNSLLRNDTEGPGKPLRFSDVTESMGLLDFHPTQTAAWADFDGDGWLDLVVGNESSNRERHPCQLFLNRGTTIPEGTPRFHDVAEVAGVALGGYVKGVAVGDVDNDGWPDLYVSRLLEPNVLLRNTGPGDDGIPRFDDITESAGVAEPLNSFPTWFFDLDNDGWLDLFASSYPVDLLGADARDVAADVLGLPTDAERMRLYRNQTGDTGDLRFADVSEAAGLHHVVPTMGSSPGDLDADGFPDVYLGTGAPDFRALVPNRMFLNRSGTQEGASEASRRFLDVTTAGGFGHLQKGHGVAFADLDHDGDQDVYAVMGGAYSGDVYQNVLFANPLAEETPGTPVAMTLLLEGTQSNRTALGARLQVDVSWSDTMAERHAVVSTGGSFGAGPLRRVIGLRDVQGQVGEVRRVQVRWPRPGDTVETFAGTFEPGEAYLLREGEGAPQVLALPSLDLPSLALPPPTAGGHAGH